MIEPEKGIFVARIVIEVKGPPTLGIVSIAIRPRDMKATGAGVHSLLQVGIDLVHNVRLVGNRQDLVFEPDLYLFFSFVILDKRKLKERQDGTNVSIVTVLELRSKGIGVRRGRIGLDLERLSDGLESHVAFEIRRRKERAVGFHAQVGSCGRLHVPHRVPIHHVVLVLGVILGQNHRKGPDPTAAVMGFVDPKWESCIHLGTKAHKGADCTWKMTRGNEKCPQKMVTHLTSVTYRHSNPQRCLPCRCILGFRRCGQCGACKHDCPFPCIP
mmetsp:Transcript_12569/g.29135  ORF Transcript_12569/g.29135 Transcript_12569/m.29135 type:complete len:271 (+) Transcript_12569:266-1078(+)